jgi:hypothetical protein
MLATEGTWRGEKNAMHEWRGMIVPALVGSAGLLLVAGTFLVVRRWSGALTQPLPFVQLVLTAAALAAWVLLVRLRLKDNRITAVAAGVIVLFALGCSAKSGRFTDWIVWSVALAAPILLPVSSNQGLSKSGKSSDVMLQQLVRTRSIEGIETIRGTLVAGFSPAERLAVLYVAFCPPLERLPSVTCEVVEGPLCDIKVAQLFHQGVRIEARLLRASTATERVNIAFVATERPTAPI